MFPDYTIDAIVTEYAAIADGLAFQALFDRHLPAGEKTPVALRCWRFPESEIAQAHLESGSGL